MRLQVLPLAVLLLLFASASASADQAEWVPRRVAEREVALLSGRSEVVFYCALCDEQSSERVRYTEVRIVLADESDEDLYQVELDGESIDAAYTYVEINGVFRNLAMTVRYDVSGVPAVLEASRVPPAGATSTSRRLDERCRVTYGPAFTRTCRFPSAPIQTTRGTCQTLAAAHLDASPGDETVVQCSLEDRSGMLLVLSGGVIRFVRVRDELTEQTVSFRDLVENGQDVRELFIETNNGVEHTLSVLAARGDEWVFALSTVLTSVFGSDQSRVFAFPEGPTTMLTAHVVSSGRPRTEQYLWNERSFRFERVR